MGCLIAKDRDAQGCFALKITYGKHLVELKGATELLDARAFNL